MKIIERQVYDGRFDHTGQTHSDITFKYCSFIGCFISASTNVKRRSIVRKVQFHGCEERGCTIYSAIIEEVLISGLKTHTLLQTWGAVFKHVKLEGNIGRIMLSPFVATAMAKPKEQAAFDKANAEYYQNVDWALDISEGCFYELDIRGTPGRLIRRDPETQVMITREKALEGKWKNIDLTESNWAGWINLFLRRNEPDLILAAPKLHPKYPERLDGLKKLRDAGVTEPD